MLLVKFGKLVEVIEICAGPLQKLEMETTVIWRTREDIPPSTELSS